jgi:hypothetical protein
LLSIILLIEEIDVKKLLPVLLMLVIASPVTAHFIWLVPTPNANEALMIFSDSLEPDANVAITKIAQTKMYARGASGKADGKLMEQKDSFLYRATGQQPLEVAGVCEYGVLDKKGAKYLLCYYAKTILGDDGKLGHGWDTLPLEIVRTKTPGTFAVLWQGKPAAKAEVTLLMPDEDTRDIKLNAEGQFQLGEIKGGASSKIGLRAKLIEAKAGELAGKKYDEVRHYSTWTLELKHAK